jgi:hypothetical protein
MHCQPGHHRAKPILVLLPVLTGGKPTNELAGASRTPGPAQRVSVVPQMNIFEITVQRKTDNRWPAVVEQSRAGALPFVKRGWLELEQARLLPQVVAQGYGRILGQALFQDDVRDAFVQALSVTDDRLHVRAGHMAARQYS